jgi:hypothetical protein
MAQRGQEEEAMALGEEEEVAARGEEEEAAVAAKDLTEKMRQVLRLPVLPASLPPCLPASLPPHRADGVGGRQRATNLFRVGLAVDARAEAQTGGHAPPLNDAVAVAAKALEAALFDQVRQPVGQKADLTTALRPHHRLTAASPTRRLTAASSHHLITQPSP